MDSDTRNFCLFIIFDIKLVFSVCMLITIQLLNFNPHLVKYFILCKSFTEHAWKPLRHFL